MYQGRPEENPDNRGENIFFEQECGKKVLLFTKIKQHLINGAHAHLR